MPDLSSITLFIAAAAVLLIVPGPAVIYIINRSLDQGRLAGIISVLGIGTGTIAHIIAAAAGISAILASSLLAFNILKYAGALYLIYLGIQKFISKEEPVFDGSYKKIKLSKIFYQGIIVNLLNPKTALFFFAFLPQFINHNKGSITSQILFLGFLFVIMGLISDGIYALLAGYLSTWIKKRIRLIKAQKFVSGSIYFALGIAAALSGSSKK